MNVLPVCFLICLGVIFGTVEAQVATRAPKDAARDDACGPGRYYSKFRGTCLPY